jgi:hypothetical protein
MKRSGIAIAAGLLLICLTGCITITNTSTGDFDFKERFDKATKEILARSKQAEEAALKGQRASLDRKVERFVQWHFAQADALVIAHMSQVKRALGGSASFFNDYAKRRAILLDFTLKLEPSLDFVESKLPNASAFPSGKVLISRPLAEAFNVNKEDYDSVLLGILIHELIHVRDGHALEQWATADGRQAWSRDQVLGAMSALTTLIPFLTIRYDVQYPITFGASKQLPALSEYAADLGAVSLLDRAGHDSGRYIAFLSEMSASVQADAGGKSGLLQQRVECLKAFSRSRFESDLQAIAVGSREAGDDVVQTWDLRVYRKIASLLDSPEALTKAFPAKPGTSDAERRNNLLAAVRKSTYSECAIRRSFPGISPKDGVLTTPTFDLAIFSQHL